MTPPRPPAIRLATQALGVPQPKPPLGLRAWSSDAEAVAVLLDATDADMHDVAAIAAQLPEPSTLVPGAPVVVLALAVQVPTGWRRLMGTRSVASPRAVRCAALLVRGYVQIGASPVGTQGTAGDLAWGFSPQS